MILKLQERRAGQFVSSIKSSTGAAAKWPCLLTRRAASRGPLQPASLTSSLPPSLSVSLTHVVFVTPRLTFFFPYSLDLFHLLRVTSCFFISLSLGVSQSKRLERRAAVSERIFCLSFCLFQFLILTWVLRMSEQRNVVSWIISRNDATTTR